MATTIDKQYASEDEKRPFVNDEQSFSSQYERMPGAKSSISETIEPYTESQILRDPRTVLHYSAFSIILDLGFLIESLQDHILHLF